MKLTEFFLAEMDREVERTRRALERVPDGHYDWKPHEKSMIQGRYRRLSSLRLTCTRGEFENDGRRQTGQSIVRQTFRPWWSKLARQVEAGVG